MTKIIDPYGSELVKDYEKVVRDFGLERFDVNMFPNPNRIMRRGIVFAGRDLKRIANCIAEKKPFYTLTGIMPTNNEIHLGTKLVVENLKYFQEHGAETYILVADLEAQAARGVSLEEGRKRALEFHIPAYIALGLDIKKTKFYFQSENKKVIHFAYEAARKITLNEFKGIYGSADPGIIMSAVTQVGDVLHPQLEKRMPGIIPVGIDQDTHIRLARDVVSRMKEKKLFPPSSIYHKYTPSLDGSIKMSKSKPKSCITIPEDNASVKKKIMRAFSGGRETLELHRKLGADVKKDICFELLKQHLIEDDKELQNIYEEYKSGRMLTGEIKKLTVDKMTEFMDDFNKKLKKARGMIDKVNFVKFE